MAAVATGSVVDEVLDPIVFGRDGGLVAVLVARDAREYRIVRGVGVAIAARGPFAVVVAAEDREVRSVVRGVFGAVPVHEGVARTAGLREARGSVTGVGGAVVVGLVATPTIAGSGGVIVAHMALRALIVGEHGGVITGQCQRRGRVRERGPRPVGGGMASGTVLRESGGCMRRVGGSVVVGLVAVPAGRAAQGVVVVHVARGAQDRKVRTGQGEARGGVVEDSARPVGGGVASGTILRESGGQVRRVVGPIVVGLVAVPAGAAGQAVVVIDVALGALHRRVETGECEARAGVVERRSRPVEDRGSVALGAVLRESGGQVRRVAGAIVVVLVAVPAGCAGQAVVVVHVATGARLAGMESHQREAGGSVIERGAIPIRRGVAAGAILREIGCFVRRGVGSVVVVLVAVPAGPACQAVVVIYVTLGALQAGVRAGQREPGACMVERGAGPVEDR